MHTSSQLSNSHLESDRLNQENMILKMKLIQMESQVNSDISSIQESNFAEEIHNSLKQRDIILQKAKLSILTLYTENQALTRSNQIQQNQVAMQRDELQTLRYQHDELRDKHQTQYQELVSVQQQMLQLKAANEKMSTEMRQKEFLISDLQKRFCNMEQAEKDFNSQFTQHLKAVDLGYQEQISKLRASFNEQTNQFHAEKQLEIDKLREKATHAEDQYRDSVAELRSKANELDALQARFTQLQATADACKSTMQEYTTKLKNLDAIALENEQNKLRIATAEQFSEELKKKVAELIGEKTYSTQTIERAREKHEKLVLVIKQLQAENERSAAEMTNAKQLNETKATQLNASLQAQQQLEKEVEQLKQSYKQLLSKNEITDKSLMSINSEFQQLQRNHGELQQYYSQMKEEYELAVSTLQIAQKDQAQTESLIFELKQNCQKYKLDSEENAHEVQILSERIAKFKASLEEQTQVASDFGMKNAQLTSENNQIKLDNDRVRKESQAQKEIIIEQQSQTNSIKIQLEQVSSEYSQLKTQFYLLSQQNQQTEMQLNEILQDKEKIEQFADYKNEKYIESQNYIQELLAFYKYVSQQVRYLHQQILKKTNSQSSIFSPKSSMADSQIKTYELYSLLGEIKTKFLELVDVKQQREFEVLYLTDRIYSLYKEIETMQAQAQHQQQQAADIQARYYEALAQQNSKQTEAFQLKTKLQEAEQVQQQAIEQRNQLKQQKQEQASRIEELSRKLKEAKAAQESLQSKLALDAKQIQEQFGGQIRNFYNKCMVLTSLEDLKNEINALYVRIGV